jgi:hypothetical protein
MEDRACADCETLEQSALNATIRHIQADSRLAIAKLIHDSRNLIDLEQLVDSLLQERIAAVRAYQEHVDAHAKKAASATMT